jgi:hypothetical protein
VVQLVVNDVYAFVTAKRVDPMKTDADIDILVPISRLYNSKGFEDMKTLTEVFALRQR